MANIMSERCQYSQYSPFTHKGINSCLLGYSFLSISAHLWLLNSFMPQSLNWLFLIDPWCSVINQMVLCSNQLSCYTKIKPTHPNINIIVIFNYGGGGIVLIKVPIMKITIIIYFMFPKPNFVSIIGHW